MQASAGTLDRLFVDLLINIDHYCISRMNVSLCLPSCHNKPPTFSVATSQQNLYFNLESVLLSLLAVFSLLVWSDPFNPHFPTSVNIFSFHGVSLTDPTLLAVSHDGWRRIEWGVCWSRLQSRPKSSHRGGHAKSLSLHRSINWLSCRISHRF